MDTDEEYVFISDLIRLDKLTELVGPITRYCQKTFGSQTVTILLFRAESKPEILLSAIDEPRLHSFFEANYAQIGYMLDPFYIDALNSDGFAAHQLREIAPDRFETSEYYARYYAATDLIDELGASIRLSQASALHLSLAHTRGQGRFRAGDLRRFRRSALLILTKLKTVVQRAPLLPEIGNAPDLTDLYQTLSDAMKRSLTRREAEVAALIVQGHSSRAIGLRLGISGQTVKVHRRNIYRKLRISSQNELFSLLVQVMRTA